jgi:hypothetical protein
MIRGQPRLTPSGWLHEASMKFWIPQVDVRTRAGKLDRNGSHSTCLRMEVP